MAKLGGKLARGFLLQMSTPLPLEARTNSAELGE